MIKIGNTYDENSVSAKNDMTEAWQKRHNPAKSYNKQFGKSYDVNFAFYSWTPWDTKRKSMSAIIFLNFIWMLHASPTSWRA